MERHGVTSFCRRVNKKRRSEICYFKTAVRLLYFVLAHEYPVATTTVFLLPSCVASCFNKWSGGYGLLLTTTYLLH